LNQIPPQELEALKQSFAALDQDRSGTLTAQELTALDIGGNRFTVEATSKLVKVFDADNSGNIGFYEYAALHRFVFSMRQAFSAFDLNKSNSLDYNETHKALAQGGFHPTGITFTKIFARFSKGTPPVIDFNGFVLLCAFLGQTRTLFNLASPDPNGFIYINLDTFMNIATNF